MTTGAGSMAHRHVKRLERRLAYLIEQRNLSHRTDLDFLKAEIAALRWALPYLREAEIEEKIQAGILDD